MGKPRLYNKAADILCLAVLEFREGNEAMALRLAYAAFKDEGMPVLAKALETMNNAAEQSLADDNASPLAGEAEAETAAGSDDLDAVIQGLADAESTAKDDCEEDSTAAEGDETVEDPEDAEVNLEADPDEVPEGEEETSADEAPVEDTEPPVATASPTPKPDLTRQERALANKLSLAGTEKARKIGLQILTGKG